MFRRGFSTFSIMNTTITKSAVDGPVEHKIINKLLSLEPLRLTIYNDSHKHSHHQSMLTADNKVESHFRIEIISDQFKGKNQPTRHRMIYGLLKEEIEVDKVHALQLKTKTPEEVGEKSEAVECGHSHSHTHGDNHSHNHTHNH